MRRETLVDESEAFMTTSRTIGVALFSVFLIGISLGAAMTQDGLGLFSSSPEPFSASVDNGMGTNQYIMVEVDEGDNDEEILVEHILHVFFFQASDRGGLVTWDFGDGSTATGAVVNHSFSEPGLHIVEATESLQGSIETVAMVITVNLFSQAEVDNMECVCAPTAKDTIIVLSEHEGQSDLEGYVMVEHDGSSESCTLRNPLQECHVRVILQRLSGGDVVEESVLFDETFRSNEKVIDFTLEDVELGAGERLQLRLETDQIRDWHKPTAEWATAAPILG